MEKNQDQKFRKKPLNDYAKYSAMGFQIVIIIFIGVFGGYKLDKFLDLSFPIFTILLSLLSVVLAIYFVVKDLLKK